MWLKPSVFHTGKQPWPTVPKVMVDHRTESHVLNDIYIYIYISIKENSYYYECDLNDK